MVLNAVMLEYLQTLVDRIVEFSKEYGFLLNRITTKFMLLLKSTQNDPDI